MPSARANKIEPINPDAPAPVWKKPSKAEAYKRYAPLMKYVVDRVASNIPKYVERDDLLNAAALGLFDALEKYDSGKGTKFETYAVWRIRGAVLDELRAMDWASRSVRRKARHIETMTRDLDQRLGRAASDDELASAMDVSSMEMARLLDEVRGVVLLSLSQPAGDTEEGSSGGLAEVIEDPDSSSALDEIESLQMSDVLVEVISQLSEQEKLVLSLYYYEEMTLKEIGMTLDISESRVSQIHTKAISRLKGRMNRAA
ncbi:MAG: FliA/WhiG family RNA polymerase sigma factor [Candidatus Eisenbacteria bacterium]|uniref:FliA/WhiG family RNA polymerase sigma factor n=1 Tax=Eiseniibacteriota bacterium TaxID=2212470 RepID=A0A7Y2E5P3_UNCEI|nr:FliA/WhiG family RNA polymerase sigma factor [Candidatus Eisenbacteria bacterium]